ncbi:DUF2975 domain-containing protein [Algoriphagus sp. AK58]|uniref:DUF2975 domain-containing protein n=1 Tax=Algoriphagus sp. AK58 TaxID=1406877 RepID=UPI00164EF686|nr:DUF2975 domain-containing protein [Algoriphagus sp. AK58]MBC6368319.1 DUF2975 domain-containing protein [Algoriphagus sp. AK58]
MNSIKTQWKEKWVNQPSLMLITVVIWSIFIGLCIKAGALLFTFIYSLFNPVVSQNLFEGLNLSALREQNIWYYGGIISIILFVTGQKAYLFYLMIRVFLKINLVHPFSREVSKLISSISYVAFQIGVAVILASGVFKGMVKRGYELDRVQEMVGNGFEFLLMAALLIAIGMVFKRGVEIQDENELTV